MHEAGYVERVEVDDERLNDMPWPMVEVEVRFKIARDSLKEFLDGLHPTEADPVNAIIEGGKL